MSMQANQKPKQPSKAALALRREERKNVFLAAVVVSVLLLVVSLLTLVGKDRAYSEDENRYLQGRPALSLSAVADGTFMDETEAWLSDQFVGRDLLVKARARLDLFEGKRDLNDVYVGKDHFLFEKPSPYDEAVVGKTLDVMKKVSAAAAEKGARTYIALAPNANELLSDYLPENAPNTDQTAQIKRVYDALPTVRGVDLVTPLKKVEHPETLYYKTDHHWTAAAAEPAFFALMKAMEVDTNGFRYKQYPVTNDFRGTLASSSGLALTSDTIFVSVPDNAGAYVVTYVAENRKEASCFDPSKLSEKDKYEVFFGGNYGEVRIDTSAASDRVLLLIKDSYANCVVPLLTPYFRTIVMVDPRYYAEDLNATMEREGITDLLWFYNVNTFLKDTSIANKLG